MNYLVFYVLALLHNPVVLADVPVKYPQNYFQPPLDTPLTIAGNFGEPRKGHFHTGLDFKTGEEEGHKVVAAADGYVSRINISSGGYGNALYITHPNGYVTVYGHLKEFVPKLMERLRKEQYAKKSFSVDFSLLPNEMPVKQGELIALSGNTGASGGPHLHFEIRDEKENAINPLLFGVQLKDDMKPLAAHIQFYAMDELKYNSNWHRVKLNGKNGEYETGKEPIKLNAKKIGIAVHTYDVLNFTDNVVGLYNIKMFDNGQLCYEYQMDRLSFKENRYVISQVDYPVFLTEASKSFNKCFVEPGNYCPVYHNLKNRGIVDLSNTKAHEIKVELTDFAGNTSAVTSYVVYDATAKVFKPTEKNYEARFDYDKDNEFANSDVSLKIPKGCLLDTVYFNYSSTLSTDPGIYSKVHQLDHMFTQAFDWFWVSIRAEKLNNKFLHKAVVVYRTDGGDEVARGGTYENAFVKARVREFGTYYLRIDTTPPHILPVNISSNRNLKKEKKILIKISDNLSGINTFNTYIDDQWVVTDYDAKASLLTHYLDTQLKPGTHTFKLVVEDERKNVAEYTSTFKW